MTSNILLKTIVVASSLLLMAGFVCYRAGALDWLRASTDSDDAPSAEFVDVSQGDASLELLISPSDPPGSEPSNALIYSTKSAPIFIEENASQPPKENSVPTEAYHAQPKPPTPPVKDPIIFSGSKSLMPSNVAPPAPKGKTSQPHAKQQAVPQLPPRDDTIMVGPKSPGGL